MRELKTPRRRFGVPPGGPWHREAARFANTFIGNDEFAPVWEILEGTVEFQCVNGTCLAVIGTQGRVEAGGQELPLNSRFSLEQGTTLRVAGSLMYIADGSKTLGAARLAQTPIPPPPATLLYLPAAEPIDLGTFMVERSSDRRGIRLSGASLTDSVDRISEPVAVGTIQRTPSGELILIGPDGPVIGGYSNIGTIIDADLDAMSLLRPGMEVQLQAIDFESALAKNQDQRYRYQKAVGLIRLL